VSRKVLKVRRVCAEYQSVDFPRAVPLGYKLASEASGRGRERETVAAKESADMAVDIAGARRLFTVEEYHRMAEVGILKPHDRVELIRGEIVEMSPIGRRHAAFVDNLTELLVTRLSGRAIVSVQNPVVVAADSEPQPDLKLLRRRRPVPYKDAEATAADVLLLIEVAETSLRYDRTVKLALYAEAGVPEYWVVDASAEAIEVYRGPAPDGYREVTRVIGEGTVSPAAFLDARLTLAEIFG
jgi:Uma2 family endonuclease